MKDQEIMKGVEENAYQLVLQNERNNEDSSFRDILNQNQMREKESCY